MENEVGIKHVKDFAKSFFFPSSPFFMPTVCFSSKATSGTSLQCLARDLTRGRPGVLSAGSGSEAGAASSFPRRAQSQPRDFTRLGPDERSGGTVRVAAPKASGQPALAAAEPVPPALRRRTRTAAGINGELQTAAGSALSCPRQH